MNWNYSQQNGYHNKQKPPTLSTSNSNVSGVNRSGFLKSSQKASPSPLRMRGATGSKRDRSKSGRMSSKDRMSDILKK